MRPGAKRERPAHADARPAGRRRARELAFRVAYQSDLTRDGYAATWSSIREGERLSADQRGLVEDVVGALDARSGEIDAAVAAACAHWPLDRLAATDRSVLRTAVAELLARPGTPVPIVLDEAIDIARRYGSEESAAFVNGVLDQVARRLRPGELA